MEDRRAIHAYVPGPQREILGRYTEENGFSMTAFLVAIAAELGEEIEGTGDPTLVRPELIKRARRYDVESRRRAR